MTTYQAEKGSEPAAALEAAAAERLMGILNDGSAAVLISIGHQAGLFNVLAGLPPATSLQIADAAGLNERYVREWLGGLVTAGIIGYEPASEAYVLQPAYVPSMTGTGVDNLARTLTFVTLMGEVAGKVAARFRTGGGLQYGEYPGFVQIQAADSAAVHDYSLVDVILPLSGRVADLRSGIRVADVGCGAGHAVNLMAQAFPASTFVGYDFLAEALEAGRDEALRLGLSNVRFELCDAAALDLREELDLVTVFDAVHDQAHPAAVLRNIRRALKPGGTFLMVDIRPPAPWKTTWTSPGLRSSTPFPPRTACPFRWPRTATAWAPSGASRGPRPCCGTPASVTWRCWTSRRTPSTRTSWRRCSPGQEQEGHPSSDRGVPFADLTAGSGGVRGTLPRVGVDQPSDAEPVRAHAEDVTPRGFLHRQR